MTDRKPDNNFFPQFESKYDKKFRKFNKQNYHYVMSIFPKDVKRIKKDLKYNKKLNKDRKEDYNYRITKGVHNGKSFGKPNGTNKGKVVYRIWDRLERDN